MERIYITLEDGEPSINIINYAKRVRESKKEKAELETVIKTTSKHSSLNQTIIKYWTLDGEFLFEKLYGEVQQTIPIDDYPPLSNVVK